MDMLIIYKEDAFFFSGTIKENLEFSNPDATYEEIIEICKYAQIHEFINNLQGMILCLKKMLLTFQVDKDKD